MTKDSRPNILWICTDQQRWDTLGCYGNVWVHTPNLDALAQGGVRFDHAYCQNPVCTPSRASFLTGRYPRTTRCRQNGQDIPEDEILVTRLLAEAGYTCGLAGKLHISACHPSVCKSAERRIKDGYHDFHWSHDPEDIWPLNEYITWLHEQGVEKVTPSSDISPYIKVGMPAEYHQTTWCANKAVAFIEENERFEQPWLFSVNIFDPHHAFDPPADLFQRYLDRLEDVPLPNYRPGELDNKPVHQQTDHRGAYNNPELFPYDAMTDMDHRAVRAAYWAMIDLIDAQVGRMLDALDRTGQRENTIVIFMADHGELLGDHGIYLKGPHFYDCAVHVPLIWSWPRAVAGGRACSGLVELVDIAPTLLDAACEPYYRGMQGRSLMPLLAGDAPMDVWRGDVYSEFYNANFHHTPKDYATMVRTRTHKLVVTHGDGGAACHGELYDLTVDPTETRNLWDDAGSVGLKADMLTRLCDRMAFTIDPLPERQSPW